MSISTEQWKPSHELELALYNQHFAAAYKMAMRDRYLPEDVFYKLQALYVMFGDVGIMDITCAAQVIISAALETILGVDDD